MKTYTEQIPSHIALLATDAALILIKTKQKRERDLTRFELNIIDNCVEFFVEFPKSDLPYINISHAVPEQMDDNKNAYIHFNIRSYVDESINFDDFIINMKSTFEKYLEKKCINIEHSDDDIDVIINFFNNIINNF